MSELLLRKVFSEVVEVVVWRIGSGIWLVLYCGRSAFWIGGWRKAVEMCLR